MINHVLISELPEEFMEDLYKKLTEENVSDIICHDNLACSSEDKVSIVLYVN